MSDERRLMRHKIAIFLLATCTFVYGCGDDSDGPAPVRYLSLAGIHQIGGDGWVAVIDCESDSLVDSLGYAGMQGLIQLYGSERGDYLAVVESGQRPTRIWDLRSRAQASSIEGGVPIFLPRYDAYSQRDGDSVLFFNTPDFDRDTSISIRWWYPRAIAGSPQIFAIRERGPSDILGDLSQLIVFDYERLEILDSIVLGESTASGPLQVYYIELSLDGSHVYAISNNLGAGPEVVCLDMRTKALVFRQSITAPTGKCRVSPDGLELWVTDPGPLPILGSRVAPGQILVLDALSGLVLDTIPTLGLDPDPSVRWHVDDIQFVPGQDKAYVNCRPFYDSARPMLVIDTKTREITKLLFSGTQYSAFSIAVVPRY